MTFFDQLQGAKVFSSIDLQSAYYQVRLKPEDVPKTAFTTPLGLYEFRVLCFGLTNAPGTFQNIMNDVLKDVIGKFVIVYLDDIVVFSKNQADRYKALAICAATVYASTSCTLTWPNASLSSLSCTFLATLLVLRVSV